MGLMDVRISRIFTDWSLEIRKNPVKIREIRTSINPTTKFVRDSNKEPYLQAIFLATNFMNFHEAVGFKFVKFVAKNIACSINNQ